ncbi:hypothetical protein [Nocardioides sp. YIM 152588]|uniref:hypothetical protein n=1 Tax=Nocardioides sp. YIM 152588 TaxID=3158259 RepID=UPI0032E491F1
MDTSGGNTPRGARWTWGRGATLLAGLVGLVVTSVLLVLGPPQPAAATPGLTLDPPSGPAGSTVRAEATGFEVCGAGTGTLVVLWDGREEFRVVLDGGRAEVVLVVPADASPGVHEVVVTCADEEFVDAGTRFEVTPAGEGETTTTPSDVTTPTTEVTTPPTEVTTVPTEATTVLPPEVTTAPPTDATSPEPVDTVSAPWWRSVLVVVALLALAAVATGVDRVLRVRRQRRWVLEHVTAVPGRPPPGAVEVETHVLVEGDR